MATIAYLTVHGQKQGDIKGGATERGREGSIAVISVAYEVDAPYDQTTGAASGKRQHKPVVITKTIDPATPKLLQALVSNEVLTSVKIEFWRPAPEVVAPYFVMVLTNALVTNVTLSSSNDKHQEETGTYELEEFSLTFQKITYTNTETGDLAEDDWAG